MKNTILVVEFDEGVMRTVSTILRKKGYKVVQAQDSSVGLREIEKGNIDLVLTDDNMTSASEGSKMALLIKRTWPTIPVIIMSGNSDLKPPQGVRFIAKPFRNEDLLEIISENLHPSAA